MRFQEKAVIVTGAARGIGRAIALAFVREGARVALVDADGEALRRLGGEIAAEKRRTALFPCNIAQGAEVQRMAEQVRRSLGRIDVLVNNAGIIRRGTIETVTEKEWDDVMAVNLKGAFLCCRAVVEAMKRQRGGTMVNVSSIAGKTGDITSAPGYASSKAGMDALTKTLARQLACYGIRVNGVAPHAIATEMSAQWPEEKRREVISGIPLGRLGTPEDVAEAVLFLASPSASFITGEILDVNGGAWMD